MSAWTGWADNRVVVLRPLRLALGAILCAAGLLGLAAGGGAQGQAGVARSIELSGTISPATADWIDKALGDAEDDRVELVIIRIDTPGGLDTSTRDMVKDIISAPMPVVAYVSPDGARAASAGVFITEAADVAAMSPQTNIGSATPISIGPGSDNEVLDRKITNDAAAYARALAGGHGRNGNLAADMVTQAVNVTAAEALDARAIDLIAVNEDDLLGQLNGFRVRGPKAQTLDTTGLRIERRDMPFFYELLQVIVDPTISYLLLLIGMIGIAIELLSGGSVIVPGAVGAVSLLLGLYGTSQLPVRITGVLLLVVAVALIAAEAHLGAGGVLGIAGIAALVGAGLLLYDTDSEALEVSVPSVIAAGVVFGGMLVFAGQKVVAAHRNEPVRTGWEEMIGLVGQVREPLNPEGLVFVGGALWRARPGEGETEVGVGSRVRVESVQGLTLIVRPLLGDAEAGESSRSAAGEA
jgi:membrane-bound serine protease (ClpP class)